MVPLALSPKVAQVVMLSESPYNLVLDNFDDDESAKTVAGRWSGFSDRVMGGVSNSAFQYDEIEGVNCIRLRGNVTSNSLKKKSRN